jgi:hypothetical protein
MVKMVNFNSPVLGTVTIALNALRRNDCVKHNLRGFRYPVLTLQAVRRNA